MYVIKKNIVFIFKVNSGNIFHKLSNLWLSPKTLKVFTWITEVVMWSLTTVWFQTIQLSHFIGDSDNLNCHRNEQSQITAVFKITYSLHVSSSHIFAPITNQFVFMTAVCRVVLLHCISRLQNIHCCCACEKKNVFVMQRHCGNGIVL